MAVASRGPALSAFRELINRDPVEARTILRRPYLPSGLEPSDDPVRMDPSTLIGGYDNEARYTFGAADSETTRAIADRPSEVLSRRPSITRDTARRTRSQLDITWGWYPSGVSNTRVCEMANDFRLRTSRRVCRAIAAALTRRRACRSRRVMAWGLGSGRASTRSPQRRRTATTSARVHRHDRHHRRLTQTRPGIGDDEYRLASFFRPGGPPGHFRVAIAVWRPKLATAPARPLCFGCVPDFTLVLISVRWCHGIMEWRSRRASYGPGNDWLGVSGAGVRCTATGWLRLQGIRLGSATSGERRRNGGLVEELRGYPAVRQPRSTTDRQMVMVLLDHSRGGVGVFRPALYAVRSGRIAASSVTPSGCRAHPAFRQLGRVPRIRAGHHTPRPCNL